MKACSLGLGLLLFFVVSLCPAKKLSLQHGINATADINIKEYWVSEKLDGIRGHWDGQHLYTRQGNKLLPPVYFTKHWPHTPLDGELWSARNQFEATSSCIRKKQATPCWQNMRFMIFDLPFSPEIFSRRIQLMKKLVSDSQSPYLAMIEQYRFPDQVALFHHLTQVINGGGEGLMLHHQDGVYQSGRNQALMKLKPFQDSEATVIAHLPGKGKYTNKLGALLVKTKENIEFKIGTGFTDQERANPPAIGSLITFKYSGKTARGVPRFASFLRIRHQATN